MQIEFVAASEAETSSGAWASAAFEGGGLSPGATRFDQAAGGALTRAMAAARFTGAKGKTLEVLAPPGVEASHALLIGVGPQGGFNAARVELAAAQAYQALKSCGAESLTLSLVGASAALAAGAALGVRRFGRCASPSTMSPPPRTPMRRWPPWPMR